MAVPAMDGTNSGPAGSETGRAARAAGLLAVTGFVTGVSNFGFNVLVARSGGVSAFGGTAALLSLVTVAGFVASGVQYAMARRAATWDGPPRALLSASMRLMWPWLICVLAACASVNQLAAYLGVATAPALLVIALFVAVLAAALPGGVLIGRRRFVLIAGLSLVGVAIRLAGGALLTRRMDATTGALLASLLPAALSVAVFLVFALRIAAAPRQAEPRSAEEMSAGFTTESFTGALVSAALWSLWVMPLVFARHLLSADSNGRFAAAQVLASGVLFVTAPVATAFYPTVARHRQWRAVLVGAAATLGLAGVASVGMAVLGPSLMGAVYGSGFMVSSRLLLELGLSAAAVSLATYAVWTSRALRQRTGPVTAVVAVAAVVEVVAGVALPVDLEVLAALPCLGLAIGAACAALGAVVRRPAPRRPMVVLLGGDEA
jgi:O-antigen/teichoic acid export membrane protein